MATPKEHYSYVINRLYPEYSAKNKKPATRMKTEEDRRLESKMLMVLYELDKDIDKDRVIGGGKGKNVSSHRNLDRLDMLEKDRKKFKHRLRSMS